MNTFIEQLRDIDGMAGTIKLYHKLFGVQQFEVDQLKLICDDWRTGVCILGQEIYICNNEIVFYAHNDNVYTICSPMQKIIIIVNKL